MTDKKTIGEDVKTVQFGWPLGMPLVAHLDSDVWEVQGNKILAQRAIVSLARLRERAGERGGHDGQLCHFRQAGNAYRADTLRTGRQHHGSVARLHQKTTKDAEAGT